MPDAPSPVSQKGESILITVRLTPNAGKTALHGLVSGKDGRPVLKAGVTATPENGKANAALVKLLAKCWRLPQSDINIRSGHKNRQKLIEISGDPTVRAKLIEEWCKTHG